MPDGYVMNREFKDMLQREVARLVNSFQPRPKRGRRPRRAGRGGGTGNLSATFMVVTTEIGPATGDISEITPGTGEAQYYETDEEGVRTPTDDDPIEVLNYDPCETYAVRTGIYVASAEGSEIVEVISAACCQLDEAPE